MACDPKTLLSQSACYFCNVPEGQQWNVLIGIFCNMAGNCDPTSLLSNSSKYAGIPEGMQLPVLIYLLSHIAGVSADPEALLAQASCLQCNIPENLQLPVLIDLACKIANV